MIKKVTVFMLIFFLLINNVYVYLASAKEFDKLSLLKLKPLPSERLAKIAEDSKNTKLWTSLFLGGLGLAVISANPNLSRSENSYDRDLYRYDQFAGGALIVLGLSSYFMPAPEEVDFKTLNQIGLSSADKELAAYYKIKTYAEQAKNTRAFAGISYLLIGLGSALMSSNFENNSYKSATLTMGAIFTAAGLFLYFVPWPIEEEVQKMDEEAAAKANI